MRPIPFLATSLVLLLLSPAAHAAAILNGSFEGPTIADGTGVDANPTAWNSNGGWIFRPDSDPFSLSGYSWPGAQDGQQYFDVGGGAYFLTQTFEVSAAQALSVRWFDNIAYVPSSSPYTASIVDANSLTVASVDYTAVSTTSWQERGLEATLSPGTYTLEFRPHAFVRTDLLIDNVSINAIPEPSTMCLIVCGAGSLLAIVARRRRPPLM